MSLAVFLSLLLPIPATSQLVIWTAPSSPYIDLCGSESQPCDGLESAIFEASLYEQNVTVTLMLLNGTYSTQYPIFPYYASISIQAVGFVELRDVSFLLSSAGSFRLIGTSTLRCSFIAFYDFDELVVSPTNLTIEKGIHQETSFDFRLGGVLNFKDAAFLGGSSTPTPNLLNCKQCRLAVTNSTFSSFSTDYTGGSVILSQDSNVTVRDSHFINNSALGFGGALLLVQSNAEFVSCSFTNNEAASGGAVSVANPASTLFQNCCFVANSASQHGGALFLNSIVPSHSSVSSFLISQDHGVVQLQGCVFSLNQVFTSGFQGGGAVSSTVPTQIVNTTFANNSVLAAVTSVANTVSVGGALELCGWSNIVGCSFVGNTVGGLEHSGAGGAIFSRSVMLQINTSVFADNMAVLGDDRDNAEGGAIFMILANISIQRSHFTSNAAFPSRAEAQSRARGGAICARQSQLTLILSTFTSNLALTQSVDGSLVPAGGGALFVIFGSLVSRGTTFQLNKVTSLTTASVVGGAVLVLDTDVHLVECAFDNNVVNGTASEGPALFSNKLVHLSHCAFEDNVKIPQAANNQDPSCSSDLGKQLQVAEATGCKGSVFRLNCPLRWSCFICELQQPRGCAFNTASHRCELAAASGLTQNPDTCCATSCGRGDCEPQSGQCSCKFLFSGTPCTLDPQKLFLFVLVPLLVPCILLCMCLYLCPIIRSEKNKRAEARRMDALCEDIRAFFKSRFLTEEQFQDRFEVDKSGVANQEGRTLEGNFGEARVYFDTAERRRVIVKTMKDHDPQKAFDAAKTEAFSMNLVEGHPHIITIRYVCLQPNFNLAIIMEYAEHGSLRNVLTQTNLPELSWAGEWSWVLEACRNICAALDFVHSRVGSIHCDLKCENVFVTHTKEAKLGDWGAAIRPPEKPRQCTALFTAPDFHDVFASKQDDPDVYNSLDVYSFGVFLCEITVLKRSAPTAHRQTHEKLTQVLEGLRSQAEFLSGCPDGWSQLSHECISPSWQERPKMRALGRRLHQLLQEAQTERKRSTPTDFS